MNDQRNISLGEIGQISVNVHDFDRAVAFYKDTLGIKHLFTVPGRMAFFDCGSGVLRLSRHPPNVGDPGAPGLGSSEFDSLLQSPRH